MSEANKFQHTTESLNALREDLMSPTLNVRVSMSIVCKMLDTVVCPCDQCEGTIAFAKSIDTSALRDECKRILEMAITAAECRISFAKQQEAYKELYGHSPI